MKFIEKSRIETFLKAKGYNAETLGVQNELSKYAVSWAKSENEKVIVPKKDIIGSNELAKIFQNDNLLTEFRKY